MNIIEILTAGPNIILEGNLSKIMDKDIKIKTLLLHSSLIPYFIQNSSKNGFGKKGLDELVKIRNISKKTGTEIRFSGKSSKQEHTKTSITLESINLACENDATFMISDTVFLKAAKAKGIQTIIINNDKKTEKLTISGFFDATTMSIHLREGEIPYAKKGQPGNWKLSPISKNKIDATSIDKITKEIFDCTENDPNSFIESDNKDSTIIQLKNYRIVITKPPFSDAQEITAVRPIKLLSLEEYKLPKQILQRIDKKAEGILIAGSPGEGKSTFARSLAEHYSLKSKIVKTIESPRDLILPNNITQYSLSHGTSTQIHDCLLLTRPDYTVFDEMRNIEDFNLYSDLRLSGVGMIGIVHASEAIDSIQRFIGKIELGQIPHIIDTVLFIKHGKLHKSYSLKIDIKVPQGMKEADLARPVVIVEDLLTDNIEFEIYSYGDETIVMPYKKELSLTNKLEPKSDLINSIKKKLNIFSDSIHIEQESKNMFTIFIQKSNIPTGQNNIIFQQIIDSLKKENNISINIHTIEDNQKNISYDIIQKKRSIIFTPKISLISKTVDIYIEKKYILSAQIGKKNQIKINTLSDPGKELSYALSTNKKINIKV